MPTSPAMTPLLAWLALLIGGLFELALVVCLRRSGGNVLSLPFAAGCVLGCLGCVFVTYAMKHFPAGTVYIMWVGIGGVFIALAGMRWWNEPAEPVRLLAMALVLVGLIALKFTATPKNPPPVKPVVEGGAERSAAGARG